MKRFLEKINTVLHRKPAFRHPRTAAIILAGGKGSRMSSDTAKQNICLRGIPILVHSMRAFDKCRSIDEIIVVCREEDVKATEAMCVKYGIKKVKCVVSGGKTRAESAECGFRKVSGKMDYVAIHDAARCLITPRQIREVASAAYAYRAASAASPVVDSIKEINRYGMIERDVPRETLWAAATPQIFHRVYYAAALRAAKESHAIVTDDNSLMELIGQRVKLVNTGHENFKITYESDLSLAEAIMIQREGKHGK